jgi:hypothetical protein
MRMLLLATTLFAVACTAAAGSKDELRARVSPAPAALSSTMWSPTITLKRNGKPSAARLTLTIRKGSELKRFAPRVTGRGSYRVRVVFPSSGRWTWRVLAAQKTLARGAITVTTQLRFDLPYDLAVARDGTIFFLDRSRVLRFDPATQRVSIRATAPTQELVGMALLEDGTLLVTDLPGNRIFRIDTSGRVSVVAQVPAPVDLVANTTGTTVWVASLADGVGVVRVDLPSGRVEPFARVENPHGIDRDPDGNFYAHDGHGISRIDGRTGVVTRFAEVDGIKLLVAPDRSVFGVVGNPSGGRVVRVSPNGNVATIAGTGALGPHRDGRAVDSPMLPSSVQFGHDGALLVTQVQPVPAIRRVDLASGTISTVVRGR